MRAILTPVVRRICLKWLQTLIVCVVIFCDWVCAVARAEPHMRLYRTGIVVNSHFPTEFSPMAFGSWEYIAIFAPPPYKNGLINGVSRDCVSVGYDGPTRFYGQQAGWHSSLWRYQRP